MSNDRLNVKVVSNQNSVELTKSENKVVVTDKKQDTAVNVTQKETAVVTIVSKGPKGDKGDIGTTITNQIATGSITASVNIGADTFKVQSGSSTFLYISSSGNIGIGTTSPTLGLLQLNTSAVEANPNLYINASGVGTTASITVRSNNGASVITQKTYNPIGGSDSLNFIQLLDGDSTSTTNQPIGRIIFSSNDTDTTGSGTTKAFIEAVSEDATPDAFLAFGTNQSGSLVTERMRITSTGNVGIGTITPQTQLHISGGITSTYLTASYIDINTTAGITQPIEGRLSWNNTDGTLDIGLKGGNIELQVGQEEVVRVVNKTDANLLKSEYKVARIRRTDEGGAQGQRLAIKLSQANNDPNSVDTLGLVAENIDNNQEGYIITSGLVRDINTTGTLQGETWNDGDVLYLSPTTAGALTNIKPIAPNHTIIIGFVVYSHNNQGKIFVKVDNGYEIDELHNVRIITSSLSSGDLLVYSGSVWINSKELSGSYGLTGSLTTTGDITTQNLIVNNITASENIRIGRTKSIGGNNFGTYNPILTYWNDNSTGAVQSASFGFRASAYMDSIAYPDIFGFGTNDLRFFASTNGIATPTEIMRIVGSTGFVGIGETSPSAKLEIRGSGATSATTAFRVENSSATSLLTILNNGTSAFNTNHLYVSSSGLVGIGTTTPGVELDVIGSIRANSTMFNSTTQTTRIRINSTTHLAFQNTSSVEVARFDNAGNWGFGVTNPLAKLHISGAAADNLLRVESPTNANILFVSSSGRVGIGTTTPQSQLHITGANALFTLSPIHPLPTTGVASASFASSGSGADLKPYFWNGSSWNALY